MHTGVSLLPCGRCSDHGTKCRPFEGQPQAEFRGLPVRGYWKPRELLFRAGEPLGPVFKITEGIAALFDMLPDGRRQLIKLLWPGALCGYLSENGRYSFEGEALTNVHACSFARDSFDSSVAHDPAFAAALRREMSEVFEEFGRHMTTLGQLEFGRARGRLLARYAEGPCLGYPYLTDPSAYKAEADGKLSRSTCRDSEQGFQ